jgi:hypothetical protein
VANVTLSELCQKHSKAVEEIAQSLDGVAFNSFGGKSPVFRLGMKADNLYNIYN